jgi:translocation and assembly module TamA
MGVRRVAVAAALIAALFPSDAGRADVHYRTTIEGAAESDLSNLLDQISQLKALESRPPPSDEALRRRAEGDLGRLTDAAHSLGYWNAHFSFTIDTAAQPARVTVTVVPGPVFHVASLSVLGPDGKPLPLPAGAAPLPLEPGAPARTQPVVATETALIAAFANHGHPFAKIEKRDVVIDQAAHTMAVTFRIAPGPATRFGTVTITGLKNLNSGYVTRRLRWRQGESYDAAKVEQTRRELIESGLFSTVRITPEPDPANPGTALIAVAATERAHRTIGAGLGYNTSQGAAAKVFWENRNLFGNAEYLRLSATGGQQVYALNANFRRPDFIMTRQDLLVNAEIADYSPTAYHSRRALTTFGLERAFSDHVTGGLALQLEEANVKELADVSSIITAAQRTQHYTLIALPGYLKIDESDNLLAPTRGYRAELSVTPAHIFSSPSVDYVTNLLSASGYWPLGANARAVLAGRAQLGSLDGPPLLELPADQRIYVGGGGTIRPYAYQTAGELAPNHDPIGGKSSLVLNLEARVKITQTIGVVPFLDAGSYYETSVPQPASHPLFYGVGLGLRYYTAFGPVRLDLATPLYRRSSDSPIQVYISLGEAF